MTEKRLIKSNNKLLLGVCGEIAEFINWDKGIVRMLVTGLVILAVIKPLALNNHF